jgi:hypothetical protein
MEILEVCHILLCENDNLVKLEFALSGDLKMLAKMSLYCKAFNKC